MWPIALSYTLNIILCCVHVGKKIDEVEPDKNIDNMTEEERVAELGRPRLGQEIRVACHIRESLEFKVTTYGC